MYSIDIFHFKASYFILMKITFLGHGCILINTMNTNIIVDPFISPNKLAKNIEIEKIKVDYILLTHAHMDHIADVEIIATNTKAKIISSFEISSHFEHKGFKGHGMNIGGKFSFDFGTLKMVNAVHTSAFPDGSYGGQPGGFVLWNKEGCIYIAGDTGLTLDMQLIPMTCPSLDIAILPIGDNFTMGYEDAIFAANFVKSKRVLGIHYDTFDIIKIDKEVVINAFTNANIDLDLLDIGSSIEIN